MREDNIGFGGLRLLQEPEEFCYGVDAVILADFASKACPKKAVDLGTGSGVIPLILSHKTGAEKLVGVELQKPSYERAVQSVALNGLEDRIKMVNADVTDEDLRGKVFSAAETSEGVDLVTCNPPYMPGGASIPGANAAKTIARQETTATLDDFIRAAADLLCRRGHLYMVHRPSRLADIICSMRQRGIEPKELRMVSPKPGAEPNIVLIHGIKGAGPELKVLDTLCVHKEDGGYTDEIEIIYERR